MITYGSAGGSSTTYSTFTNYNPSPNYSPSVTPSYTPSTVFNVGSSSGGASTSTSTGPSAPASWYTGNTAQQLMYGPPVFAGIEGSVAAPGVGPTRDNLTSLMATRASVADSLKLVFESPSVSSTTLPGAAPAAAPGVPPAAGATAVPAGASAPPLKYVDSLSRGGDLSSATGFTYNADVERQALIDRGIDPGFSSIPNPAQNAERAMANDLIAAGKAGGGLANAPALPPKASSFREIADFPVGQEADIAKAGVVMTTATGAALVAPAAVSAMGAAVTGTGTAAGLGTAAASTAGAIGKGTLFTLGGTAAGLGVGTAFASNFIKNKKAEERKLVDYQTQASSPMMADLGLDNTVFFNPDKNKLRVMNWTDETKLNMSNRFTNPFYDSKQEGSLRTFDSLDQLDLTPNQRRLIEPAYEAARTATREWLNQVYFAREGDILVFSEDYINDKGEKETQMSYAYEVDFNLIDTKFLAEVKRTQVELQDKIKSTVESTPTQARIAQDEKIEKYVGVDPNNLTKKDKELLDDVAPKVEITLKGTGDAQVSSYRYSEDWQSDSTKKEFVEYAAKQKGKTYDTMSPEQKDVFAKEVLVSDNEIVDPNKPPSGVDVELWNRYIENPGVTLSEGDEKVELLAGHLAEKAFYRKKATTDDPTVNSSELDQPLYDTYGSGVKEQYRTAILGGSQAENKKKFEQEQNKINARREQIRNDNSGGVLPAGAVTREQFIQQQNADPEVSRLTQEVNSLTEKIATENDDTRKADLELLYDEAAGKLSAATEKFKADFAANGGSVVSGGEGAGPISLFTQGAKDNLAALRENVESFKIGSAKAKGRIAVAESQAALSAYDREVKTAQSRYERGSISREEYDQTVQQAQQAYDDKMTIVNAKIENIITNDGEYYKKGWGINKLDAFGEKQQTDVREFLGIAALTTGLLLPLYQELYSRPKETEEAFERQKELMALQFEYWKQQLALETAASGGGGGGGGGESGEGSGTTSGNTSFTLASV